MVDKAKISTSKNAFQCEKLMWQCGMKEMLIINKKLCRKEWGKGLYILKRG